MVASAVARGSLGLRACFYLLVLAQLAAWIPVALAQQDDRKLDRARLQTLVESFARAWNRADLPALARLFAEEAVLLAPADSEPALQQDRNSLGLEQRGWLRGTRVSARIAAIDFPTENIAVLEGNYRLTGVRAGSAAARTFEGPLVFRLQRNGNDWQIARARFYRPTERALALRDAHSERYPFVAGAGSEALVIAGAEKLHQRRPAAASPMGSAADAIAAETAERTAIGR
jgi:ketosteroid isomerase-like protein